MENWTELSKEERLKALCAPYSEAFNQEPVKAMAVQVINAYEEKEPVMQYPLEHATIEGVCLTHIREVGEIKTDIEKNGKDYYEVGSGGLERVQASRAKLNRALSVFEKTEPRAHLIADSFLSALDDTSLTHNFDRNSEYTVTWTGE